MWKKKYQSLRGCITLIKVSLSNLPTYCVLVEKVCRDKGETGPHPMEFLMRQAESKDEVASYEVE